MSSDESDNSAGSGEDPYDWDNSGDDSSSWGNSEEGYSDDASENGYTDE